MANDDNTTVSFRLPASSHEALMRQAEAAGTTKHQLARTLLVRALDSHDRAENPADLTGIEDAFEALQLSLADLRMALGRGVGAILQQVATDMDQEGIRKWVFERIITPTPPSQQGDSDDQHQESDRRI